MKTQYYTTTSLDGFIATEDDSLEWLFPLGDLNDSSYPAFISEVGALAMGSATYEWMLRNADKEKGTAEFLRRTTGAGYFLDRFVIKSTGLTPRLRVAVQYASKE